MFVAVMGMACQPEGQGGSGKAGSQRVDPKLADPKTADPEVEGCKTVDEILALHEESLGAFARADFVRSAIVFRNGSSERVRITVRREPFAYREDWTKPTGSAVLISDGRRVWGSRPGQRTQSMGARGLLRYELLPAPLSRAVLERAFVMGRRYLDRELWTGRSGVDASARLEAFPQQGAKQSGDLEVGRAVLRMHVIAAGEARIQFWIDAKDGRLWAITEPDVDRRWRRFGKFVKRGKAWIAQERVWGLYDREGGAVWQLQEPKIVQKHPPRLFPFPYAVKPAWRTGPRLHLRYVSSPWHRGLMVEGLTLNGHRIDQVLFDTGASQSALLPHRVRALQLFPARRTSHGTIADRRMGMLYWFDRLRLSGIAVDQSVLLSSDPGQPLWLLPDRPMSMLLGGEAIFGDAPVLDIAGGQLLLRNAAVTPLSKRTGVGPVVELPMQGDGPGYVPVRLGDRQVMALVDSGWSGLFLFSVKAAIKLGLPATREALIAAGGRSFVIQGVGGAQTTQWEITVPSVSLGPIRFDRPRISVQDPEEGDPARTYDALVGCGALAHFRKIGFDPLRHKLEIEPGMPRGKDGLFHVPSPPSDPGLLLRPAASSEGPKASPTVIAIVADSPAALVGIQPGDRLISLDNRPCHSQRFDAICRQLEQDTQGVPCVVQRDARRIRGSFP